MAPLCPISCFTACNVPLWLYLALFSSNAKLSMTQIELSLVCTAIISKCFPISYFLIIFSFYFIQKNILVHGVFQQINKNSKSSFIRFLFCRSLSPREKTCLPLFFFKQRQWKISMSLSCTISNANIMPNGNTAPRLDEEANDFLAVVQNVATTQLLTAVCLQVWRGALARMRYRRMKAALVILRAYRRYKVKSYIREVNKRFKNVASMKDCGRHVKWPTPPKVLRKFEEALRNIHNRFLIRPRPLKWSILFGRS